jgi:hypothetical protein
MRTLRILALALSTCALGVSFPALAAKATLVSTLNGANETAGGDPDGTGSFTVDIDSDSGDFCYTLTGTKIAKPTMAHIHSGAAGANGAPVITIDVASDMCVAVDPEVLKAIIAAPASYYVNIHTADFPAGAIRGQLAAK